MIIIVEITSKMYFDSHNTLNKIGQSLGKIDKTNFRLWQRL